MTQTVDQFIFSIFIQNQSLHKYLTSTHEKYSQDNSPSGIPMGRRLNFLSTWVVLSNPQELMHTIKFQLEWTKGLITIRVPNLKPGAITTSKYPSCVQTTAIQEELSMIEYVNIIFSSI